MPDFSFLFGPLTANKDAEQAGAPRPDEIAAVLSDWRREGLQVELPKARSAEAKRREQAFGDLLKEFPVHSQTREMIYRCPRCDRTVALPALAAATCPDCGGDMREIRAADVVKIGDDMGALFTSPQMPSFHLSIETLMRTLDLPRWFLDLGPHMRQMKRIPVNLANLGIMLGLFASFGFTLFALGASLFNQPPGILFWRLAALIGAGVTLGLLAIRPFVQTYIQLGRDKVMLVVMGHRRVLHYQNISEVRDDRRLNGFGYALYLGHRYGRWLQWLYAGLLQWFDPRAWFGWYRPHVLAGLPPFAGDPTAPYWRHRIIIRGPRQSIRMPYNARMRRDLTQVLAVVIFQARSMSPTAKIQVTALQAAQKGRATQEQWQAGIRV